MTFPLIKIVCKVPFLKRLLSVKTYFICPKGRTVFAVIEKAGTESLRLVIMREEGIQDPHLIWDAKFSPFLVPLPKRYLLKYTYVAIVRNPYFRLVSGFLDKFCTGSYRLLDFCELFRSYYRKDIHDNDRITFEEFVSLLVRLQPETLDDHFKPQTLMFDRTSNTEIFKLENARAIADRLHSLSFVHGFDNYRNSHLYTWKKVSIPNAWQLKYREFDIAEKRNKGEYPEGADGLGFQGAVVPFYGDFYNPELKSMVYNYYRMDFEQLGYSSEIG